MSVGIVPIDTPAVPGLFYVRAHSYLPELQDRDQADRIPRRSINRVNPSQLREAAGAERHGHFGDAYKAAYIETVAREHKAKISTFFSRIHAPHEFKGVSLGSDVLLQRDTGAECPVSEISTGQRAALALSIFLSLNSSVSEKAPWLLFDDPIVHVDDLNILSFFDTLRDLVLLGSRQVFFATANTKLADIFARKFDFLGSNFKEFRLQR